MIKSEYLNHVIEKYRDHSVNLYKAKMIGRVKNNKLNTWMYLNNIKIFIHENYTIQNNHKKIDYTDLGNILHYICQDDINQLMDIIKKLKINDNKFYYNEIYEFLITINNIHQNSLSTKTKILVKKSPNNRVDRVILGKCIFCHNIYNPQSDEHRHAVSRCKKKYYDLCIYHLREKSEFNTHKNKKILSSYENIYEPEDLSVDFKARMVISWIEKTYELRSLSIETKLENRKNSSISNYFELFSRAREIITTSKVLHDAFPSIQEKPIHCDFQKIIEDTFGKDLDQNGFKGRTFRSTVHFVLEMIYREGSFRMIDKTSSRTFMKKYKDSLIPRDTSDEDLDLLFLQMHEPYEVN
ncbi:hypothetical protein [Vibrio diazotrophicus]|uniref:hypothetical protein n=1 Tax=Vibrio diazotrophicus TaxID=685 RepID=UPI000C9E284F|nr:hypothetical protein [Vibrio diazotrophicus]PNH80066.1 hypothetical protein C1N27_11025 [Vibrio diazotrophicus]